MQLFIPSPLDEPTNVRQAKVLNDAFEIFVRRNALRGDLWAAYDTDASLAKAREKLDRLDRLAAMLREAEAALPDGYSPTDIVMELRDDALDLINEVVFTLRHVTGAK